LQNITDADKTTDEVEDDDETADDEEDAAGMTAGALVINSTLCRKSNHLKDFAIP